MLGVGDDVLDIAVTPDRGYALSIRGVAREAATAYGVPFADPGWSWPISPPRRRERNRMKAVPMTPDRCDLFTLRTITGFDPAAPTRPGYARLIAGGMRSVSLAVDVTNYVMLETGQPLHAFDLDLLQGPVRARRAAGETLETLDHVQRQLVEDDPGHRRRPRRHRSGRRDGRTDVRDQRRHDQHRAGSRPLRAGGDCPDGTAPQAEQRGITPVRARVDPALPPFASERAAALLLEYGGEPTSA